MAELIFPDNFDEKCTIAQDDLILMADSEDWNKIKKAKYSFLKWETGTAATIEVWCVCTWAPWTTVCINNSGTCSAAVLDFTIPKWDKWDTGCTWPAIVCAEFNWNNIDFTEENWNVVVLEDAKICLQWPQWCTGAAWNGICCATLNPDYTLTLQYTNGCCDTTWSIRWEQWPQWCEWPQGCTWATGNGICCIEQNADYSLTIHYTNWCCDTTWSVRWEQWCQWPTWCTWPAWNWICCLTSTKAWKVTTVEAHYTCWWSDCFSVCDWQDWQWAWDMLACVYDPNGCESNAFDMDNMEQWTTNKFVSVGDINNWNWKASVIWFSNGTTKAQINTILSWLYDLQQVLFSTANSTVTRTWLWNTAPNAAIKWIITKYTSTESVHILAHTYNGDVFTAAYKYSNWTLLSSIEYKQTQLTTAQLNAVNSGITSEKVGTYDWYATSKQDKISDLDTIRAWATCWASALQSINCWDVTTALWYTPAQSCDIPTDNCQLCNGCWYTTCTWTVSSCADIISKLWYTPYNSTNPNGYTSCTGTLTAETVLSWDVWCTYTIKVSNSAPWAWTPATTITLVTE